MSAMADARPQPLEHERIVLSFPAAVELVVIARFTAATVASRAGFDIDDLEDLRLAVDELCISLGPLSSEETLRLTFERSDDTVEITAGCVARPGSRTEIAVLPGTAIWEQGRELSSRLLDSLVDDHGAEIRDGQRITWLRKCPAPGRR